jgi:tRNA(fMet)-specific endonuclease VapC
MAGERCVDTSVAVRFLNGEASLLQKFEAAGELRLSPVVVGELFYGAVNSGKAAENLIKVDDFTRDCVVLEWSR